MVESVVDMDYQFTQENPGSLIPLNGLNWNSVYVLPVWQRVWWQFFGQGNLNLSTVRKDSRIIGIAPLIKNHDSVSLLGSVDVCDYLDFVVATGAEDEFFNILLGRLSQQGITQLDLKPLRPESTVLTHLVGLALRRGLSVTTEQIDVSLEVDLPHTWNDYLQIMDAKQRHEVKRKQRRLLGAGEVNYRVIEDAPTINSLMDTFFDLFRRSRSDKAGFMTPQMESFFRQMVDTMAKVNLLRMGVMEFDGKMVSMVMYFDYQDVYYLYNSGYDPDYSALSVGVLCKVYNIQDAIAKRKKRYDFLKGGEAYKYHLGGKEVPIYHCRITMGETH